MDPERLRQIETLFHAARELEGERQADFLKEACGADESLRRQVESLLGYQTDAQEFIELPAMDLAARALAKDGNPAERMQGACAPAWLPARIGSYRVIRLLGEGGMGVVYEAEQEQPRRVVALKVIKPGLTSPQLMRRFEQESQALARLQHPGIAQIYEAGTADTGFGQQPYFAMELVRGQPLRTYAGKHHLDTGQRLQLMVKICEAVQHAHQRGLIHRDLKPANILVDETGQPKILDFGVARVTDGEVPGTRQTDLGQLVGTLAYMSPEQALGDPLELDTRSDVYALGVILYELLAGRLPYELSRRPHEAARTIQEEDPTPLSSISRVYRGDIETIVAKALEKDKARRYASASALAADIQRYWNDEPITARPPSASYQLRKFARRHRSLVAGVAAVFVVLLAGIVASTWEAANATRQRDRATAAEQRATKERDRAVTAEGIATAQEVRARDEAATANAVKDFLQNDLLAQAGASAQAGPDNRPDRDLKVRTALDRAASRIEGKFQGLPLVEASIRLTIGKTYQDLGLYPEAQAHMERALTLQRQALGPEHHETLQTSTLLADLYALETKYAQAETLFANVLAAQRHQLGGEHSDTLATENDLAVVSVLTGKYAAAEPLYVHVLQARRRLLGDASLDTLETMNNLAQLYRRQGKFAQAEPLFLKVLEGEQRALGEEHPTPLGTVNNLATLYFDQGKYGEAEPLFTKVLQVRRRVLGDDHTATLVSMNNLALLYQEEGKFVEAEPLFTKILEVRHRAEGDEHPATLVTMNNLATLYRNLGKYGQAEPIFANVLQARRRVLGPEHPDTLRSMGSLAMLYLDQGRSSQAEPLLTEALQMSRRLLGEGHPDTLVAMNNLATLYLNRGDYTQAEPLYRKVVEAQRRVLSPQHPKSVASVNSLAFLYLRQERYAEAESLLRNIATLSEKEPATWGRYRSQSMLGASLAGQKKYSDGEPLLVSGYQGMLEHRSAIPAADQIDLEQAVIWIVQLYRDWQEPERAAAWGEKLTKKSSN